MSDETPVETLSTAARIGVLGDLHGDMEHTLAVSARMHERGVRTLLVLGDFGFIWPRRNWAVDLSKLSRRLAAREQALYFVDGNHEDFARLYRHPIGDDGLRWLRPNIAHLPRGYRTALSSGKTLAALGGAASIDVGHRVVGQSWWPEETITDHDLEVLGHQHACVLVGHDAPIGVPTLEAHLAATTHWWPEEGLAYSARGREMFHRGFLQVWPALYLGGHYHLHLDETVEFDDDDAGTFTSRIVILNMNGLATISQAVLDVDTLQLDFFTLREEHPPPGRTHEPTEEDKDSVGLRRGGSVCPDSEHGSAKPDPTAQSPNYTSAEDSARFYATLGRWVAAQAVMDYCKVAADTLREWRENNHVLGAEFNDGNFCYPAAQFRNGGPAPGLADVLAVLSRGHRADATRIAWFAGQAYIGEEMTRWDVLLDGKISLLIEWAKEDTARIIGR